jgi:hypothetical protein
MVVIKVGGGIFASKAGGVPHGTRFLSRLLVVQANIKLGWK